MRDINFVMEDALSFEGNTGPYVQYTYARASSVREKAEGEVKIDADTVIYAVGMKGKQEEAKAFALSAPIFYQIGDCLFPKNIYEANRLGYNAAMDIGQYW